MRSFIISGVVISSTLTSKLLTRDSYRIALKVYERLSWSYISVGTATRYGLGGQGIASRWRRDVLHSSRPALGPTQSPIPVFLNRRAAARYRALRSIIPGRERPKETTVCYKISLVQLINNLNVILYLPTCHTVYISVLILFMIMP